MGDKPFTKYGYLYCPVDGCYRMTDSNGTARFCARHARNFYRYGQPRPRGTFDWVSDTAGPECRICGRSVYEHRVVEFCQEIVRKMVA